MSVTLRKRRLPSGRTQLYLDIYRMGTRRTEALGFFLEKNGRFQNRETLKQAEEIRAKKQLDFRAETHGLTGTHNRKAGFINYLEEQKDLRTSPNTKASWHQAF